MFNLNKKTQVIFIAVVFALAIFIFSNASNAKAAAGDNVSGYAWSENIGWISFNCANDTCATSNYGVNLDMTTKNLSGFAWSDSIGWISFNAADGCPAGACQPRYDSATGEFLGWARVLSWDGWISLNCANSGCGASNYKTSLSGSDFAGWAWEDDVIGWISFNSKNCDTNGDGQSEGGAGCPPAPTLIPNYKVYFSGICLIDGTACAADTNQCTNDICSGGACIHPNKTNNTTCDDGKSCTDSDNCSGGICAGTAEVCGNNICRAGCETPAACPTDCFCGDGIINGSEVCDKKGNAGCSDPTPVCRSDCSGCKAPALLKKFTKPVTEVFTDAAKFLLSVVGGIALFMLVFSGIYYLTSGTSPERQSAAKRAFSHALLGVAVVLVSYAVMGVISKITTEEKISIANSSVISTSGLPGTIFTIKTTITAPAGVNPSTTKAHIQNPDESDIAGGVVDLFDDGAHSDGAAGDSVYGNTWNSAAAPAGPYFVDINGCDTAGNCAEAENI